MIESENTSTTRSTEILLPSLLDRGRHRRRGRDGRKLGRLLNDAAASTSARAVLGQVVEGRAESLLSEAVALGEVHDEEDDVRELRNDEDPSERKSSLPEAVRCQLGVSENFDIHNGHCEGPEEEGTDFQSRSCRSRQLFDSPAQGTTPPAEGIGGGRGRTDRRNAEDEEEEADGNLNNDGSGPCRSANEEEDTEAGLVSWCRNVALAY